MQTKQIWQVALGDLARAVSPANFETWLRTTQMLSFEDGCATIGAPNSFAVEQLRGKFAVQIQETLEVILGRPVAVRFTTTSSANGNGLVEAEPKRPRRGQGSGGPVPEVAEETGPGYVAQQLHQLELEAVPESGLNPRYVFEKFIVGSNNRLAHAAALAVADRP
ncbi:MAG TPA: DnaA N-terminal domain-containing protein, partial [Thermomicrobiaceae bacterium]|nr:DnaA N-terminal domain-containing protein [Thermomicrobiaceae bacterium]